MRDRLAVVEPAVFLPEPVALWTAPPSCLGRFYSGDISCLAFQLITLTTVAAQIYAALLKPGIRLVVSERSMDSNREIFARPNLDGAELAAYELIWSALDSAMPGHERVTVYLAAEPVTCDERVKRRGRVEEAGIPRQLHDALHGRHECMMSTLGHLGLRIDASNGPGEVAGDVERGILSQVENRARRPVPCAPGASHSRGSHAPSRQPSTGSAPGR